MNDLIKTTGESQYNNSGVNNYNLDCTMDHQEINQNNYIDKRKYDVQKIGGTLDITSTFLLFKMVRKSAEIRNVKTLNATYDGILEGFERKNRFFV